MTLLVFTSGPKAEPDLFFLQAFQDIGLLTSFSMSTAFVFIWFHVK